MSSSRRVTVAFALVAIAAAAAFVVASAVPAAQADTAPSITIGPNEIQPEAEAEVNREVPNSRSEAHVPSSHVPRPATVAVTGAGGELGTNFSGLNHFDQRVLADGGNQFSLEPPDQGLCVGNGFVVEPVNDVVRIYDTAGNPLGGVASLTKFYSGKSQIDRSGTAAEPFGPFLSDPKCYYDPQLGRFFMTVLEIDQDPVTGAFGDHTAELIAVSKSGVPTTDSSDWFLYSIDTSDAGGAAQDEAPTPTAPRTLPSHPGCPCLGDQPLIGADTFGFYVTTNEFSIEGPEFNGAQVYAISKAGLAAGVLRMQAIHGAPIPLAEGPAYSLQPATSPTAADWDASAGGTEYLLSALDFDATLDDRIAVWALTNTSSLDSAAPAVRLSHVVLDSEVYGQPPDAVQKDGPTPLAQVVEQLNGAKNPTAGGSAKEELLAGNDDRMNQAVFAAGHLWGAVNTVVKTGNGPTHVGAAYFDVTPSTAAGSVAVSIAHQGYVAVNQQNVLYPSIGVTHAGKAVMTLTLAGPGFFPSAVYTTIGASGPGPLKVAGAGLGPDDGFTGYAPFGGPTGRWGDYSAAVADGSGHVWLAQEYIGQTCTFAEFAADTTCGGTRSLLANWGTYVSSVTP